jgi:hypothetical protein
MGLIELVVILVVVGVLLWLVETQIPMDASIKTLIKVVVIVVVVLWLLRLFVGDVPIVPVRGR